MTDPQRDMARLQVRYDTAAVQRLVDPQRDMASLQVRYDTAAVQRLVDPQRDSVRHQARYDTAAVQHHREEVLRHALAAFEPQDDEARLPYAEVVRRLREALDVELAMLRDAGA